MLSPTFVNGNNVLEGTKKSTWKLLSVLLTTMAIGALAVIQLRNETRPENHVAVASHVPSAAECRLTGNREVTGTKLGVLTPSTLSDCQAACLSTSFCGCYAFDSTNGANSCTLKSGPCVLSSATTPGVSYGLCGIPSYQNMLREVKTFAELKSILENEGCSNGWALLHDHGKVIQVFSTRTSCLEYEDNNVMAINVDAVYGLTSPMRLTMWADDRASSVGGPTFLQLGGPGSLPSISNWGLQKKYVIVPIALPTPKYRTIQMSDVPYIASLVVKGFCPQFQIYGKDANGNAVVAEFAKVSCAIGSADVHPNSNPVLLLGHYDTGAVGNHGGNKYVAMHLSLGGPQKTVGMFSYYSHYSPINGVFSVSDKLIVSKGETYSNGKIGMPKTYTADLASIKLRF